MAACDRHTERSSVRFHQLTDPLDHLEDLYHGILKPSFSPEELGDLAAIRRALAAHAARVWVASDQAGRILGMALGEYDSELRIMLLSWLAVRPGFRGAGIGGPLLGAAMRAWQAAYEPCLILAEVEDPAGHTGDELHGDPAARLRFYQRLGARPLDLPYFQASLGPGLHRVPDVLLMVLRGHPKFSGEDSGTIDGAVLRAFLEKYQRECEGAVAHDAQAMLLWQSVDRPGGVPFKTVQG